MPVNTPTHKPFYLFELMFGGGTLYLTDTDITVVWSGNQYLPAPIQVGGFGKATTDVVETLTLVSHNVDRATAGIVLAEDIRGKEVNIYRSDWTVPGSYNTPFQVYRGQFDSVAVNEGVDSAEVTYEIKNDFVRWEMSVPRHSYAGSCQWKFKSTTPGCQYTGAASLCNKTWDRCAELSNVHRFRGFRWLPMMEDKEILWGKGPNPDGYKKRGPFGP